MNFIVYLFFSFLYSFRTRMLLCGRAWWTKKKRWVFMVQISIIHLWCLLITSASRSRQGKRNKLTDIFFFLVVWCVWYILRLVDGFLFDHTKLVHNIYVIKCINTSKWKVDDDDDGFDSIHYFVLVFLNYLSKALTRSSSGLTVCTFWKDSKNFTLHIIARM